MSRFFVIINVLIFVSPIYTRPQKLIGKHTLTNLFAEPETVVETAEKRQGRSQELDRRRNELLCARYYFYRTHSGAFTAYDQIIEILSDEFYLSEIRVAKVILDNTEILIDLKKSKPPISYFVKKYRHFRWEC